jgi:hypothetical protein
MLRHTPCSRCSRLAAAARAWLAVCAVPVMARAADPPSAAPAQESASHAGDTRGTDRPSTGETAWGGPMSQHVYLDAQTGVEAVQLRTFFADFDSVSAGFLPTVGVGPTARIGAGLRFGFLTLGLRGRVAEFEDASTVGAWQIWSLDAEVGIRVPLHRVEPHLVLAGGYSTFGGLGSAVAGLSDGLDVHGVDVRLGGGVDYWVTRTVSLGLDLDGELLAIARPGVSVRDLATAKQIGTLDDAKARILEANGSSWGAGLSLNGAVGVHF